MGNLVYGLVFYTSIAITTLQVMKLGDYDRRWRAFVPLWNLLVLGDLVGITRETWFLPLFLVLFAGPVFFILAAILGPLMWLIPFVLFFTIGAQLAIRTDRALWIGLVLTIPIIQLVGWPALAHTSVNGDGLEAEGRKGRRRPREASLDPTSPEAKLMEIEKLRQDGSLTLDEATQHRRRILNEAVGRTTL